MKKIKHREYKLFCRIMDEHIKLTYNPENGCLFDKHSQLFGRYYHHAERFDVNHSNYFCLLHGIFNIKVFPLIILFLLERFPEFKIKKYHNFETCLQLLTPEQISCVGKLVEE